MTSEATTVELQHRVLPATPYEKLESYLAAGGGAGLEQGARPRPTPTSWRS